MSEDQEIMVKMVGAWLLSTVLIVYAALTTFIAGWIGQGEAVVGEKGTMTLLRPGSESFEIVGKFEVPKGSLCEDRQRDAWTHPVIHRASLYLRNHDLLLCYDIKAPPQ